MYRICKQFTFEAAHSLSGLHDGHKCRRVHGHSYKVTIVLQAEMLDKAGMVIDFGELTEFKTYLNQNFDHRMLNDVIPQPTVENLARHIFDWCNDRWRETSSVTVYETDSTWAEYSR